MEEINLKDFWNYYKRYLAIIVLFVIFAVLAIVVYDKGFKTPLYSTYTTVVLVKDNSDTNSNDTIDQSDVILNQKLVSTYREIIKSRLVLEQVINQLNLDYSIEQISKKISVTALADTEILKIVVTDEDPKLATIIANQIADVFDREIKQIYKISNVSIIDRALVPEKPSNNNTLRDAVLMFLLASVGSSAIVFVIFYFDDTIRDVEDIENEIGVPVISKIYKSENNNELVVADKPNALVSESIRTLRTNLQFSSVDKEFKTILVTSSVPSEGKSFISANLAAAFAQNGKKVLLIDCDLRKGRQHNIFHIEGNDGLSNLLISDINKCSNYFYETKINKLYVMPRGIIPPNPSELLNSKKNESLINVLKKFFDVIILDGAPISGLSDSIILSTYVDKVLLVTAVDHTPKSELKNTVKALQTVNASLMGCVANNVDTTHGGYYGKYYYYYSEDGNDTTKKKVKKRHKSVNDEKKASDGND